MSYPTVQFASHRAVKPAKEITVSQPYRRASVKINTMLRIHSVPVGLWRKETFVYPYFPRQLAPFSLLLCVLVLVILLTASARVCAKSTGGLDLWSAGQLIHNFFVCVQRTEPRERRMHKLVLNNFLQRILIVQHLLELFYPSCRFLLGVAIKIQYFLYFHHYLLLQSYFFFPQPILFCKLFVVSQ